MDSVTGNPLRPPSTTPPLPTREDCWSEDATYTLIDAWGDRYLELNRGNLRQKHWQEVADAVNDLHGHATAKSHRTDIQCKNRIDTLKKKYKTEKSRVLDSNATYVSQWPFFNRLDALLGPSFQAKYSSPPPLPPPVTGTPSFNRRTLSPLAYPSWPFSPIPVGLRSAKRYTPAPSPSPIKIPAPTPLAVDESHIRRNLSDSEGSGSRSRSSSGGKRKKKEEEEEEEGYRELAEAIERLGDIYERVESKKQKQMVELEKQRMQFTKDLESQRMQLIMDTQLQLQKINRVNPSAPENLPTSESAFLQFGAACNLLAMEGYSLCRELDGNMSL